MNRADGIVVVTSCTATKADTANGNGNGAVRMAESLYAGQQHLRLMRGVRAYRNADRPAGPLKLRILSAYYGLLPATRKVATYDHAFTGLPRQTIRRQARRLAVPEHIRTLLARPYALAILLLGDDYLEACALDDDMGLGGPTLAFCGPRVGERLPQLVGLRHIALSNREARRFGAPLIALKGELGGRLLRGVAEAPRHMTCVRDPDGDVLHWLESVPSMSRGDARRAPVP